MRLLRDSEGCRFEQLIDLCGLDYSDWKNEGALTCNERPATVSCSTAADPTATCAGNPVMRARSPWASAVASPPPMHRLARPRLRPRWRSAPCR